MHVEVSGLWRASSPSTMWVIRIELRSPGLCGQDLYLLSHLVTLVCISETLWTTLALNSDPPASASRVLELTADATTLRLVYF